MENMKCYKGDLVVLVDGAIENDNFVRLNQMSYNTSYTVSNDSCGFWIYLEDSEGKIFTHSCYESSFKLAKTDVGDDLVGRTFKHRDNKTCVYTLTAKHTMDKKPTLNVEWLGSSSGFKYLVEEVRNNFKSGVWILQKREESAKAYRTKEAVLENFNEVKNIPKFKKGDSVVRTKGGIKLTAKLLTAYTVSEVSKNDGRLRLDEVGGAYNPENWVLESSLEEEEYSAVNIKSYSAEQLLRLFIKDKHGCTRKFQPGYNSKVLRAVNTSIATDVLVNPIEVINEFIDNGQWTVLKGEKATENNEQILHLKTNPLEPLVNFDDNSQWQHYNAQTEEYSITQPEEETIMQNKTNEIVITVPMAAYALTETITSYGKEIRVDDEEALLSLIVRIDNDQAKLKDLNRNAKSKRIVGQINKLGAARTKITALIDALPDEGEDES